MEIEEEKKKSSDLLLSCLDFILNIANEQKNEYQYIPNPKESFNIDHFDNEKVFYNKLLYDLNNAKNLENLKLIPKIILRNLIIFLKYVKQLNEIFGKELYKDPIVKIDISIIVDYVVNRFCKEIFESLEFFALCRKELEIKYNLKCTDFSTIYDEEWKKMAQDKMDILRNNKIENFSYILHDCLITYRNSNNYDESDKLKVIMNEYFGDMININMKMSQLDEKYFNNENMKKYIDMYVKKQLSILGYKYDEKDKNDNKDQKSNENKNENNKTGEKNKKDEEDKKIEYKALFDKAKKKYLYQSILNIDLTDVEKCVYLLNFEIIPNSEKMIKAEDNNKFFFNIDDEYQNLLEQKRKYDEEPEQYLTKDIKKAIEDKTFIDEFEQILNSSSVKDYFDNYKLDEDNNLKDEFIKFKNNLKEDPKNLEKLFIYKYLPKSLRAFVNPLMRIVLNPLFLEPSECLPEDRKIEIIRAYLFIIIIHEMVNLLKFMKEDNDFSYS